MSNPSAEAAEKKLDELSRAFARAWSELPAPQEAKDRVVRVFKGIVSAGFEWLDAQRVSTRSASPT